MEGASFMSQARIVRAGRLSLSLSLSPLRGKQNFTIRLVSLREPVNRHLFRRSLLHQRSILVGSGDKAIRGGRYRCRLNQSSDGLSIFRETVSGLIFTQRAQLRLIRPSHYKVIREHLFFTSISESLSLSLSAFIYI